MAKITPNCPADDGTSMRIPAARAVHADRFIDRLPGGLAAPSDPFLSLTLRRLDEAANWKDARDTLHELHRLLYEDVTLLPLFQTIDYFVYQAGLSGIQDRPIAFYQNVERWRVVPPVQQE